jgi:hypothetical protein
MYSDKELRDFITNCDSIKQITKDPYLSNLNTITKYTNEKLYTVLQDANKYYPIIAQKVYEGRKIKSGDTNGTMRTLLKTLLALMKFSGIKENQNEIYQQWYPYFIKLNKKMVERADNNVADEKTVAWSTILEIRDKLEVGTIEHVILSLYTMIPPRRQYDYWKVWVTQMPTGAQSQNKSKPEIGTQSQNKSKPGTPSQTGTINLTSRMMKITEYKTADKYNDYITELPQELIDTIKLYMNQREKKSNWLFAKKNGTTFGSISSFTDSNNNVIKKALGNEHASVNSIRHAAASFVATNPKMLRGEKKAWANAMGHSLNMQSLYVIADE